jgi:2-aminoethylphosphonate dioxygenase
MAPLQLTSVQVQQYKTQGYLKLRVSEHKLIDPAALKGWSEEVRNWPRVRGKWMPYDEINENGERQLMRTENFVDYHDQFKALLCGDDLPGILKQVAGDVSRKFSA